MKTSLTKQTCNTVTLTIDTEHVALALGKARALAKGLAGEFHPILLPGDSVGHVGHGCRPAVASLQMENTHGGSGSGQAALLSNSVKLIIQRGGGGQKQPTMLRPGEYRWQISCCNN